MINRRLPPPLTAALALALILAAPAVTSAQSQAYLDAVSDHFDVARDEVEILSGWGIPDGEIPVVLSISRIAGVSPDAVLALRRGGRSWAELSNRYGVSAARLHVRLPDDADAGVLARLYDEYRSRPSTAWVSIEIRDDEMVNLVNLRFLSTYLSRSPAEVVAALTAAGSPSAALARLRGD